MSLSITVTNPVDPKAKGDTVDLPAEVFDAKSNISLMHQVVVGQLAAARQGTHKVKTRGEVRGGGKKPYRQKGTGRARQGSVRAPQFVGGGVVHGPTPRSYDQRTPKKMKAAALRGALSDRARNDRVHVVSALVPADLESHWTAAAAKSLAAITTSKNVLLVVEASDDRTWRSVRNLPTVHLLAPGQLNTYDVLISDDVVFTQGALEAFLAGPVAGKSTKSSTTSTEADTVVVTKPAKAEPETDDADAAKDFGPGSHAPLADVAKAPKGFPIKGNASSMLYHVPDSAFYERTDAEVWFRTAEAAEAAGFELPPSQREDETDTAEHTLAEDGAMKDFGPGSHAPLADVDKAPKGFPIKGNASSLLYHVPDSAFYERTDAEVWFSTAEAAEAAGFELPPSQREKTADDSEGDA